MILGKLVARLLRWCGLPSRQTAIATQNDADAVEAITIEPVAAELSPDDLEHLPGILDRLASLAIGSVTLVASETCDPGDLIAAARMAKDRGLSCAVRGRATLLAQAGMCDELRSAGVAGLECLFLSAIDEVHDALAGVGDCRLAKSLLSQPSLHCSAFIPLVPATLATLARTLDYLSEQQMRRAAFFAIVSPDDEPSSWALSIEGLVTVAAQLSAQKRSGLAIEWHPPQRFDPKQTLAQQVRRGPRSRWNSIRVECDGRVYQPVGEWQAMGNLISPDNFVPMIRLAAGHKKCQSCVCSECCKAGCIRDPLAWALA